MSIPLISAVAVSLLAELWTCDQRDILYIVFMRVTMSIYSVLGGFVGTYSEDEQDYRLFCPDERYQLFHDASTDLARSINQMNLYAVSSLENTRSKLR